MTKRRWLYWGLPIIGAVVGIIITFKKGIGTKEGLENQVDATLGAVLWLMVITTVRIILMLPSFH